MSKTLSFLLLFLLLISTPAPLLSAPGGHWEESFSDATAYQVCVSAAPRCGSSSEALYGDYLAGRVTITDLGPVPGGRRYALQRADIDPIIIDVTGIG